MATRKRSAKAKTGKQPARRTRTRGAGGKGRRRAAGARRARSTAAARQVRPPSPFEEVLTSAESPPSLRLAEPPLVEPLGGEAAAHIPWEELEPEALDAEAADREAAELARRIEAAAGTTADALRRRTEAAEELGRRREELEARVRQHEESRELPGAGSIALELATGAVRLVRALATAPFRIGLAFLRPREA